MQESQERRIRTYVEGFDKVIGGGIPQGNIVLLSGRPGTMKSSMAFNMLYKNASNNGIGSVYVSFEQGKQSLIRQMKSMGMDVEGEKRIRIVDLGNVREELEQAETDETVISVLREHLSNIVKEAQTEILVLDSLDVLDISVGATSRRSQIFFLFEWLREMNLTSVLISESDPEEVMEKGREEGYLSDGIINLSLSSEETDAVRRRIRCVKMRNTEHDTSYYSLQFQDGRFVVTQSMS
ncbi:MAG: RAD55 family ATPase [Thermoplasmata archaeon]|nr:RAD55 family ATPase [Candidatus Sysuiplasma acidicola]MBX8646432.1 RAD55 family ATPase [Candidatus Sysuiplasma acidicola]